MRRLRFESFQWLVGLFCSLLGTMMLVSPHQFQFVSFQLIQLNLFALGLGLLITGLLMLLVVILNLTGLLAAVIYLSNAVLLISLSIDLSYSGGIINAINLAILGVTTAGLPFIMREARKAAKGDPSTQPLGAAESELLLIAIGLSTVLNGLLLMYPNELTTYNYSLSSFQSILFGLPFIIAGGLLLYHQAANRLPFKLGYFFSRSILSRVLGVVFLAFIFAAVIPGRFWLGAAYYGWFGLSLIALPRLFPPKAYFDPTLLYSRLAIVLSTATTLPLILAIAIFNYLSETSLQVSNLDSLYQMRDTMLGVLLVLLALTVYIGSRLAIWLSRPLELLSDVSQAMANEDMDVPLPSSSVTEINHLTNTIQTMRSELVQRTSERENALEALENQRAQLEIHVANRTEELVLAKQRLEAVLKALPVGVMIADKKGAITDMNDMVGQIWGEQVPAVESIEGYAVFKGWWPENGRALKSEDWALARAIKNGEISSGQVVDIENFNGEAGTVLTSAAPFVGPDGEIAGAVAAIQDISRQRELEQLAREAAREAHRTAVQIEAIFNAMTDAVVVYNQDGMVVQANPQAIALYGFDPVRMSRETVTRRLTLINDKGEKIVTGLLADARVMAGETSVNRRMTLMNARGRTYRVLSSTSPVYIGREVVGFVDIWHDITEREKLLAENNRQRELLERLISTAPVGIAFVSGESLRYTLVNEAYAHIARGRGELIDHPLAEVWHEVAHEFVPLVEQVLQTGEAYSATNRVLPILRNGILEDASFTFSFTPVMESSGEVEGVMILIVETTEEVQARKAVEEEHSRLLAIMENAPEGIIMIDREGKVLISNPASQRLSGLWLEGQDLNSPELQEATRHIDGSPYKAHELPILQSAQNGATFRNVEMLWKGPGGRELTVLVNSAPVTDHTGQVTGAVAAFMDITDLVQVEQALRESESRFRGVVESIDDVVVTLDENACFTGIYGRSLERYGLTQDDFIGKRFDELMDSEDSSHADYFQEALEGRSIVFEWSTMAKPGLVDFQISASPLRDEDGKVKGVVAVSRDITAIKRTESALEKYTWQLKRSNQELEQFAFIASHDLQEPLRKIHAFGERIRQRVTDRADEEEQDYLERMMNASNRMQKMIQDLLTFSRVTTKGQPFEMVDLDAVATEVISDLELRIERTGAKMEVGELPEVEADPMQMHQLLQNLIGNALKYHDKARKPKISVSAEMMPGNGKNEPERVRLVVADNGIGFDPQYLERIFQPFERLHGRSEYEGTGMGLAICQKIVERHQGTITAVSQPGEGAQFIIELPVRQKIEQEL